MNSQNLLDSHNHLFELARLGQLRLSESINPKLKSFIERLAYPISVIFYALFVPIIAVFFAFPVIIVIILLQGGGLDPALLQDSTNPFLLLAAFLPIYLLVWAGLWLFEQRQIWTTGLELPGWLAKYARGLLVGFLMFGISVAILALLGFVEIESGDQSGIRLTALLGSFVFLIAWIVQGGAEELLARGFVLPVIGVRFGSLAGVLISSLLFMVLHLLNPNLSLIGLLNLFLFGLFAALFALYEGGLWGVFAIHTVWNWAQGNIFGFEVSGTEVSGAIIFNLAETGPDWLTGGAFGPEGGLVVTLILLISSFLVWLANWRRAIAQSQGLSAGA